MKMGFDEDIRFGITETRQLNSPVKSYKLSIDEHSKYIDKEEASLIKVREMAREGFKTPKEIALETGVNYEKVQRICYYENKKRHIRYAKKRKGWQ